ncbi:MAG: hypothetical protein RLZZ393_1389 [Pseudomonadota bacterium]|jgi:hypothetical protein
MDLAAFFQPLEASFIGEWMRGSLKAMPVVEATHVLAAATVFGTIFVVDLRLLGIPGVKRAFTRVSEEMTRITWAAFALAAVTGVLMFIANAHTYLINRAFGLKLTAIVAAGINMLIFERYTRRGVAGWDVGVQSPRAAKIAGLLSILLWVAVLFLARWIGFTKAYDFSVPDDPNIQFNF